MDENHYLALTRCLPTLAQKLNFHEMTIHMRYNDNFTSDNLEYIYEHTNENTQANRFVDILKHKPQTTFQFFLKKLEDLDYVDVLEILRREMSEPIGPQAKRSCQDPCVSEPPQLGSGETNRCTTEVSSVETLCNLSEGPSMLDLDKAGVPFQPDGYVDRKELNQNTIKELKNQAKSRKGRLIITGMGGIGKTMLAAQTLRSDYNAISQLFSKGIVWLSIGKEADLFEKLKYIAQSLKCLDSTSTEIEQVQRDIRQSILDSPGRVLIVLDNIWSKETARAFDCIPHAVITSRNLDVMDGFSGDKFQVPIERGFSEGESLSVLIDPSDTEHKINALKLHEKCGGLPFLISIIGYHVRENKSYLNYYTKLVEEGNLHSIETVGTDYDFKNCAEVIEVSYNDLNHSLETILEYFSIFDESVSAQTLRLILDVEMEEMEIQLTKLINRSLVTKERFPDGYRYGVHDIMHKFINGKVKSKPGHRQKLCRTVLEQCEKHCERPGQWWTLKTFDQTIWFCLTKLMREAELTDMLQYFLTDLRTLETAIERTSVYHVFREFKLSKKMVDREEWEAFYRFFKGNIDDTMAIVRDTVSVQRSEGDKVVIRKRFRDVIQLALIKSEGGHVYDNAEKIAKGAGNGLYWTRSGEGASREHVWQSRDGNWKEFDLSPNGDKLAAYESEAYQKGIKIIQTSDGERLFIIETESCPRFVRFNRRGNCLLSVEENSIKLWSLPGFAGKPQVISKTTCDNLDQVDIAALSFPQDDTVLVVSKAGELLRYSLSDTCSVVARSELGHGSVKFAAFSDNGQALAVQHVDNSLVVYEDLVSDLKSISYPQNADAVKRCLFFPVSEDESRIVLCERKIIRIWDYRSSDSDAVSEFKLEKEIHSDSVTISRCKKFLAAAVSEVPKCVHLYILPDLKVHKINASGIGDNNKMEFICNDKKHLSETDHKLLILQKYARHDFGRLSMRTFQLVDELVEEKVIARNLWVLKNGILIRLLCISNGKLKAEIFSDGKTTMLQESTDEENSSEPITISCLNSERNRLAVAIKNVIHIFSIMWDDEDLISEVKPVDTYETEDTIDRIFFINEQKNRLLLLDNKGSLKIKEDSGAHKPYEIKQLEPKDMKELVDLLYFPIHNSLLTVHEHQVCRLPLEKPKDSNSSKGENIYTPPDEYAIRSVSVNCEERYLAVKIDKIDQEDQDQEEAIGKCVLLDFNSPVKKRVKLECNSPGLAFHPMKPTILCMEYRGIRLYSIENTPNTEMQVKSIGTIDLESSSDSFAWSPDGEYLAVCSIKHINLLSVTVTNAGMKAEILWTIYEKFPTSLFFPLAMSDSAVIAVDKDANVHCVSKLPVESKEPDMR